LAKLNAAKNIQEKELAIMNMAKEMNCKSEFLFMLNELNVSAKISLISSCLGRKAPDKIYTETHTEILLIRHAKFHLFTNLCLGIINLNKNYMYNEFYVSSSGRSLLYEEIYHLAGYFSLDLKRGSNFYKDKKIIFTKLSSKELIYLGIHLNSTYFKKLSKVYSDWAFFTRLRLAGDNLFSTLKEDILDKILIKASPSKGRFYHRTTYPSFFQAAQLGKERGRQIQAELNETRLAKYKY
jgi:hypothetical protein